MVQAWSVEGLKQRLFFVLYALLIFVIGTHIPAPGVDSNLVQQFFQNSGSGAMFNFMDVISGGALRKLSIFALGIMPYINASIMMQLLVAIDPRLKEVQQEGEEGRKRISKWTRYLAIVLAFIQGGGLMFAIHQGTSVFTLPVITGLFAVVGGTCFLMWLADEINQKGVGNGSSLIIQMGIIAGIPAQIFNEFSQATFEQARFIALIIFGILTVVVIAGIVYVQLAARRIPIQYARRQIGKRVYGGQSTYLPIKIAQAGVIPIIFAVSVLMVPSTILGFFPQLTDLQRIWTQFNGSIWYVVVEFLMVLLFTFVYTAVTFQTQDVADNLKKNNGFIPGIRPGKPTFEFLDKVLHRVTLFGGLFLGLIAILPTLATWIVEGITRVQISSLYLGGTSLLIVVGVALDTVQQMQAHMVMRHYSGFAK
ncbi:preprotein translocase subunit SecY [bacterium]|nr:preprotein translocase subunit SecY [bacterium]